MQILILDVPVKNMSNVIHTLYIHDSYIHFLFQFLFGLFLSSQLHKHNSDT
jgi:hypothetical protein